MSDPEPAQSKEEEAQPSIDAVQQEELELISTEAKGEESKESAVSYESLVVTLKEKNKELKKLEAFKMKIEDRLKKKAKEMKALSKEKTVLEEFAKIVIPKAHHKTIVDAEGKYNDLEALNKLYVKGLAKSENISGEGNATELLIIIKEENEHLKMKILEMSEEFKKHLLKMQEKDKLLLELEDKARQFSGLEELLAEKDKQIESLKNLTQEYSEMKGKQLLEAIKASKSSNENAQLKESEGEDVQHFKQLLSEKTNKILQLQDQLQQLKEQVADKINQEPSLAEDFKISNLPLITPRTSVYSKRVDDEEEEAKENEIVRLLQQHLAESEQARNELNETVDANKVKARKLLVKKDLQIQRVKMMLQKIENHLKSQFGLAQDQIAKLSQLNQDDHQKLSEIERQLDLSPDSSPLLDSLLESNGGGTPSHLDRSGQLHLQCSSFSDQSSDKNIVYIRNVFVKYLEYLAITNTTTDEIRTMESLLFSELNVTKEQAQKLDQLRKTNSFWKKVVIFSQQPVVNSKITAGELKKKFLGGMSTFIPKMMQKQGNVLNNSQLAGQFHTQSNNGLPIGSAPEFIDGGQRLGSENSPSKNLDLK